MGLRVGGVEGVFGEFVKGVLDEFIKGELLEDFMN